MRVGTLRALWEALFFMLLLAACPMDGGGGNLPYLVPAIPAKNVENPDGDISTIRALCYVDTDLYSPLNPGDYVLKDGGGLFFDYVVLGAAQIRYDKIRGPWLYIPPNLSHVLENRKTYVKPLQVKGIRVLLSITGGGDRYSFGSLTTDEAHAFTGEVMGFLIHYGLDGVELNDENAGPSPFYPDALRANGLLEDLDVDFDRDGDIDEDDDEKAAWYHGGDMMCNLTYYLRLEYQKEVYNRRITVVREANFGRYFPDTVSGSADEPIFAGSASQSDYFVNSHFYRFNSDSAQREPGSDEPMFYSYRNKYAPFMVDLGGDPQSNTDRVVPTLDPASNPANPGTPGTPGSINDFSVWFKDGGVPGDPYESGRCDYGLLYYHNLKAVSEAAAENYLTAGAARYTQAEYMSLTSQALFGDDVVLAPGAQGNYLKDW